MVSKLRRPTQSGRKYLPAVHQTKDWQPNIHRT
jgi:hypothetical protein